MDTPPRSQPEKNPESWGAVIGIVIIVALLILGGLYFFLSGQGEAPQAPAVGASNV